MILDVKIKVLERDGDPSWAPTAAQRAVQRSLERRRAAAADEVARLIRAAFELIRETGELSPRVSEILARAGLSNQAFYRHFRSKDELLAAVLDDGIQQLAGYLEHRMAKASGPEEAVRAWLRGVLAQALEPEAARATRPFALARGRLADEHPDEVGRSERRLTEPLRVAIEAAVEGRQLPADTDAALGAEALYHLAMGWLEARLIGGGARPEAARQLEAFALAGLRGARGSGAAARGPRVANRGGHGA